MAKPIDASNKWFLALLGLPFFGVGIFLAGMGWQMWSLWFRSESWIRVPATVTSAEFSSHRGSKGGYSYSVKSSYDYAVKDSRYSGSRVGLEGDGGSSDSYHRARYDILVKHRDSGTPLEILVNPQEPFESVIFRERTSTMYVLPMCGLVFGLPGLWLVLSGFKAMFQSIRGRSLLAANPGRPWRVRTQWQSFELRDRPGLRIAYSLAGGVFTGIFVSVFWIAMGSDRNAPLFAKAIIGGITLIPLGCFAGAIYQIARAVKYGNPRLVLSQIPFLPGQDNAALLYVDTHIEAGSGIEVKLSCLKKESVSSGRKTTIQEREIYSETKKITEDLAAGRGVKSAIPIHFTVPQGIPETLSGDLPNYIWKITARAATPGVDFFAEFEVPVFNVNDARLVEVNPMTR